MERIISPMEVTADAYADGNKRKTVSPEDGRGGASDTKRPGLDVGADGQDNQEHVTVKLEQQALVEEPREGYVTGEGLAGSRAEILSFLIDKLGNLGVLNGKAGENIQEENLEAIEDHLAPFKDHPSVMPTEEDDLSALERWLQSGSPITDDIIRSLARLVLKFFNKLKAKILKEENLEAGEDHSAPTEEDDLSALERWLQSGSPQTNDIIRYIARLILKLCDKLKAMGYNIS